MRYRNNISHKTLFVTYSLLFPTLLVTLFGLIFLPATLHATELELVDSQTVLSVLSEEPSTGTVTTLEASGQWRNGCVPDLDAVELTSDDEGNGLLLITALAERVGLVCGQSEVEWRLLIDVQFDLPGTYAVQLSIASEQLDSVELYTLDEIVVTDHLDVRSQPSGAEQLDMPTTQAFDNVIYLPSIVLDN